MTRKPVRWLKAVTCATKVEGRLSPKSFEIATKYDNYFVHKFLKHFKGIKMFAF